MLPKIRQRWVGKLSICIANTALLTPGGSNVKRKKEKSSVMSVEVDVKRFLGCQIADCRSATTKCNKAEVVLLNRH